jgi:predicted metallo-beta-lactamase superfamily hydrolase
MLEAYAEYGVWGVMVAIVGTLIYYLTKKQSDEIGGVKSIIVKLIDRHNRSDEAADRRHEDMLKELNDISDDINYLKGKSS